MIQKVSKIFNGVVGNEEHNVHHAAFWLALFSLTSAFLGMFRDRLLAANFGASRELDIYYAAFRAPDVIYTLMLLFSASTAVIPVFLEARESKKDISGILSSLVTVFLCTMLFFGFLAFILMPYFIGILLPGFSDAEKNTAVFLSRILLFSPLLLGLSNIFSSVSQSFRRFFAYGLAPVFYNFGIIFGILVFLKFWGLTGLALGVVLGAMLHFIIQIPAVLRSGIKLSLTGALSLPSLEGVRAISVLSFPRTVALEITQVFSTVLTGLASTLAAGSIAIFNLALNLEFIPITVIGLSYSIAAFPALAEYSVKKAKDHFVAHFSAAFRHILFWALPFSIILLVLRAQIVRVIFGSGQFSWADTRLTAASLMLLAFAITFQSMLMLLVRAFHAEGESWRPLFINIVSTILSIGAVFWFIFVLSPGSEFAIFLGRVLRVSDIPDIRVIALSLGILVGSLANFFFLAIAFWREFGWFPWKGALRSIFEISFAGLSGGAAAHLGLLIFANVFDLHVFFGIFLQGFFSAIMGVLVVVIVLWILKNRELAEVYSSTIAILSEREKERAEHKVPTPEQENLI